MSSYSHPLQCIGSCIVFASTMYWNLVAGNLGFHKVFSAAGDFSETVFSWDFCTMSKRCWSGFMSHCRIYNQDRCVCILPNAHVGETSEFCSIWCYIPQLSKAFLFMFECQIVVRVGVWTQMKNVLFSHVADITVKHHLYWLVSPTSCYSLSTVQYSREKRERGHFSEAEHYTPS